MEETNKLLAKFDMLVLEKKATWWHMELPSGEVFFGTAKTDMLGYEEDNFNVYQDFTKLLHPEDYEKAMQAMRDHLEGKADAYETTYRIQKKDGEYLTFYDYGVITEKEGENISLIGLVFKVDNESDIEQAKEIISQGGEDLAKLLERAGE